MAADDRQLLQDFTEHYEESVFGAIVSRHGPMVMGVCRRLLRDGNSADDAFQATFLALAQNAKSIRRPEALASWLHGVAWRIARRLRAVRPAGSVSADSLADLSPGPATQASWREIEQLVDEELEQLPDKFRLPLVLCHLQGLSQAEAARALGWPARSLSSRLERGSELLRQRLGQRGVALVAALLTAGLAEHARAAVLPEAAIATVRSARLLSLGQGEAARQISATAVNLAEGVLHAMWISKIKMTAAIILVLILSASAVGLTLVSALQTPPVVQADPEPAPAPAKAPQPNKPLPDDPLEAFQEALRDPVDPNNLKAAELRKANLLRRAQALQQIGDLRAALALQEWRHEDLDRVVAQVDGEVRKQLVGRFQSQVQGVLREGEPVEQLAALTLLGDIGASIQGATPETALTQGLIDDVISLVKKGDASVRQAAARTLGQLHGEPKQQAAALGALLTDKEVANRRAAADGLFGQMKQLRTLARGVHPGFVIQVTPEKVVVRSQAVASPLPRGIRDEDARVRSSSLAALEQGAAILAEFLDPDVLPVHQFPAAGRLPSEAEKAEMREYAARIENRLQVAEPLANALVGQVPAVVQVMMETEPNGNLEACATLEAMAHARANQLRLVRLVPALAEVKLEPKLTDSWRQSLAAAVPGLIQRLGHADVRVRLSALYVLETLEDQAVSALSALIKALDDPDAFVRWGAVRALGRLGPAGAVAVPELARKLADSDGDVRITAAAALERFGPRAGPAVFALARTLKGPDLGLKQQAMKALAAVGVDAAPVVPALAAALLEPEVVVRLAAAQALRKLGPVASAARPALQKALLDPNPEVRTAASEALLAIKPGEMP